MGVWSFLKTTFFIIKMMFSLPGIAYSYYSKRRKAIGVFKKELIESGIPPNEAGEIAGDYPFKLGDIIQIARDFSSMRQPQN
jgi:hypothetical protein